MTSLEPLEPSAILPARTPGAGPREGLSAAALRRLQHSVPDETWKAYQREMKRFLAWCQETGSIPLPCATDTLTNWIADRADLGHGLSAIKQGIGAVVFFHEEKYSAESPLIPVTKDAWRIVGDYRRERADAGVRELKAATFTPEEFRRMVASIAIDTPAGIRDRAMLAVTISGFFRRSNTLRLDLADVAEVLVEQDGDEEVQVKLFVTRSKTDQAAKGKTRTIVPGEHELSDPVGMLQSWLCELQAQDITSGALWRAVSRTGRVLDRRLHDDYLRKLVKRTAAAAGLSNPRGRPYRAHSLRASGVTIARRAGKSWSTIREQGDWSDKSPVVLDYDRPEEEDHAMRGVGL